ncbi:MAG TPA: hypothetical protein VFH10_04550 [Nocardioides sp.]|uniref:hypothetical protein n=1 Tax=Nocardioides sp. TaxID=35761 RepID=UPI002D7EF98C|nr:hypothetical protein [Nocardioides sp.]HET6651891.1 hypothetical protein [Nocardioides sp.]
MFIQIIQGRCKRQDEMRALGDRWLREVAPQAPGWLGGTYGFTDDGEMIAVIRFESKDAAMANSQRPEQQAFWAEMERLYDGPVEFHDCERVVMMMDGGSDQAGFVQVIRGKLDDPDALESGMHDMETMLHEARPEIIGATFAIEDDGTFTETVAFTDEAAARRGESQAMPISGPMHDAMMQFDHMVHDVEYRDLHAPWFASRT